MERWRELPSRRLARRATTAVCEVPASSAIKPDSSRPPDRRNGPAGMPHIPQRSPPPRGLSWDVAGKPCPPPFSGPPPSPQPPSPPPPPPPTLPPLHPPTFL